MLHPQQTFHRRLLRRRNRRQQSIVELLNPLFCIGPETRSQAADSIIRLPKRRPASLAACCSAGRFSQTAPPIFEPSPIQNSGEKLKTRPLPELSACPNRLLMPPGPGKWGRHMGMLAGLRAVGIRILFDQSAGEEGYGTTLGSHTRPEPACAGLLARLSTGPMILVFLMVIAQCARAEDTCIDPSTLAATTVSITRYFTADEKPRPSLDGYRATAWFYRSTRYLVSIAHFVDDATVLPRGEWRNVEVRQRDVTVEVSARLLVVVKALQIGRAHV
jgi:hypothetical protein